MAIRFLTDSTADILPQEAAQRDIDVVPLKVLFGETAYRDGIDLDHPTFYQMLSQSKALPTTPQPAPPLTIFCPILNEPGTRVTT